MADRDITECVQRIAIFEDRCGVRIEGLAAFLSKPDQDGEQRVAVRGELHPLEGSSLAGNLDLELAVIDRAGRVVGMDSDDITAESFLAFHTFDLAAYVPQGLVEKLRLLPKLSS